MRVHGSCHCETHHIHQRGRASAHSGLSLPGLPGDVWWPYRSIVPSDEDAFQLLSGELTIYNKIGDSGNARSWHFVIAVAHTFTRPLRLVLNWCRPIFWLAYRSLAEVAEFVPAFQVWCDSRLPWVDEFSALPGKPKQ